MRRRSYHGDGFELGEHVLRPPPPNFIPLQLVNTPMKRYAKSGFLTSLSLNTGKQILGNIIVLDSLRLTLVGVFV